MLVFLNGKAKNNINFKDCKIIGNELAKLHKASKKIKYKRKNSLGYKEWLKIYKKTKNPNKMKYIIILIHTKKKYSKEFAYD